MIKLVLLLVLGAAACRSLTGRWPWDLVGPWLQGPAGDRDAKARTLLGVGPAASREEIIAAHRKLLFEVHPDRGGNAQLVHEANAARDLLLAALGPANRPA